jgi:glucose/mannose-6-phosphate isomerase
LDDIFSLKMLEEVDRSGVRRAYDEWPRMARAGFAVRPHLLRKGFRKAFFLGMGGSAAGGDIVASWLSEKHEFETATFKGQLPVGDMKDAIAVACSASGQTEETIEMLETAVKRGATAIAVSCGGRLMQVAKEKGVPHVMMPKALAPRYTLPFIIFSCLSIINEGLGLHCEAEAEGAMAEMEREREEIGVGSPLASNPSKKLALAIIDKIPVIYGARPTRGAGIRFKNMLNENAKTHAIFDGLPDAFHNEVEAWEDPSPEYVPVFLRHPAETPRDRVRADAMVAILSEMKMGPIEVSGRGGSSLAQLVTMVYRLDLASFYVAMGKGQDPLPTRLMDRIKEKGRTQ